MLVLDFLEGSVHITGRSKMGETCIFLEVANVNGLRIWTMLLEEGFNSISLDAARCARWPADEANALKSWIEFVYS